MATTSNPLKWHGGKQYLTSWIISHMPSRCKNPNKPIDSDPGWLHYVEPYFGGGAILFAQDPNGISEVVNDLNSDLSNFWDVLRSPTEFGRLSRFLSATPMSESLFNNVKGLPDGTGTSVDRAFQFFIRYRQSRQGLGKCFATLSRNRTRQGMNEQAAAWFSAIEGLPEAHARLKRVVIMNDDAISVIKSQDGPRTLFYLDPPYVHTTRHKSATGAYEHEMTNGQHMQLLTTLKNIKGRFLLSGYDNGLYHSFAQAHGWSCEAKEIDNKSSSKKVKEKKIECLWKNY